MGVSPGPHVLTCEELDRMDLFYLVRYGVVMAVLALTHWQHNDEDLESDSVLLHCQLSL